MFTKKRILSLIIATAMLISILPAALMSANADGSGFGAAIDIAGSLDQTITGSVTTSGQVVYYTFTVPVTGRYQIRTDGVSLPVRFTMYNANQTQISYYNNEYLIELTAETTYYLTVRLTDSSWVGDYKFIIASPGTRGGKGGTFATAIDVVPMDEVIDGSIKVPGQVDYHIFTAPVTGRYQIRTDDISMPVRFTMFNANQTQINYYNNEYLIQLTAGTTYYLTVAATSSSATGDYSVTIVTPYLWEGQEGGSFETAKTAPMNSVVSGNINLPGKVDYFIFEAPTTGSYQIRTDGVSEPVRFTLYNANQSQINYYNNEYNADLTAGTTYYLAVAATSSGTTGEYFFVIDAPGDAPITRPEPAPLAPTLPIVTPIPATPAAPTVTPYQPNGDGTNFDSPLTAAFDQTMSGTFAVANQIVYYAFAAPVTGRYHIKTDGISLPTRFTLYNANQSQINYYNNEYLVELTAGTIYYLSARAVSSSETGTYAMRIVTPVLDEGNGGTFETAVSLPMDEVINGEFNVPGKTDYFIFKAPLTGRYQIKTDNITNPIRFTLYNANQSQINYYNNEYLAELTAGTTYYLAASGTSSSQTGDYSFTIITPHTTDRRGGSFETSILPQFGQVIEGKLNVPGKVDYYIFQATTTGSYTIKSEGGSTLRFTLYRNNQTQINYYNNEYNTDLVGGTVYYVAVSGTSSSQTGDYSFRINTPGADITPTFIPGRVLSNDQEIGIMDALEILKYLAGISNVITTGGEGSRAWNAAMITGEGSSPGIMDALEILKKLAGIQGVL